MKRQFTLRGKLIWSALLCFLLPLVGIYLVTNYLTKDLLLERAVSSSEESLKAIQSDVNGIIDEMLELSNLVITNSEIRQQVIFSQKSSGSERQRKDNLTSYARLARMLDELFRQHDGFYVTILGKRKDIYTNYSHSDYNPMKLYGQSWFPELDRVPAFSTYWVGLQQNFYSPQPGGKDDFLVTIGRPIRITSNSTSGYVVISLNERKIRASLIENGERETMLLDDNGYIVSHTDPGKIGSRVPWWNQDGPFRTVEVEGESYVYAQQWVNDSHWRLVSLDPVSAAVSQNKQILLISFGLQILFFTLFCILLLFLISTLMKPIRNLGRFITQIGRGRLDIRSGIRGNNEAALLGRTIDHMLDRIQSMIEQITLEQSKKRKAELEMLQAQINPHFMFNLLNSIRLNILIKGDQENADLIASLSSLLRMTINRQNEFIKLIEELDTVRHYMMLMNFRHANQVRLEVDCDEACAQALVPRFMIQPFIENAIIHGFEQFDGDIFIKVVRDGDFLRLSVRDNGIGMDRDALEKLRAGIDGHQEAKDSVRKGFSGIGVQNVFQRLQLIYGCAIRFEIHSESDVGTEIIISFPLEYERGENSVDGDSGR
ncbi:cache domain-containing sensor histidine kinase [Paenibacillus sp. DMB20]|uniref:cache domain-containing sensor histidine kinase n=1 Tax=Paenibacillus sp. DMB20 TaxID=1642570 RepID=UPI0006277AF7|nr:histidine kinase [Paenibacillus sp. DMB20]KKO54612.1 histidine kinase [Paenibacillus sp. DMB20]